jgi:hypothetical protein
LYARSCGTQQRRFSPTTISCTHSFHPAITRLQRKGGRVAACRGAVEHSGRRWRPPRVVHGHDVGGAGFSSLVPGVTTFEISPVALFGGIGRRGGEVRGWRELADLSRRQDARPDTRPRRGRSRRTGTDRSSACLTLSFYFPRARVPWPHAVQTASSRAAGGRDLR